LTEAKGEKMKKTVFVLLVACFFTLSVNARQGGNFGLGAVLGDPVGLSMKYWTGKGNAVSGAFAFDSYHAHYYHGYWDDNGYDLYIHANYLWHNFQAFPVERGQLPLFWGVGGRMIAGNDFAMGARACGGLEYLPLAPIDIYLELGFVLDFIGHIGPDVDLGLGLRYFF
jgi:hypothetical protein